MVDPEPEAKFAVEANIHSSWAEKNWQPIEIAKDVQQYVKLHNQCIIDGKTYVIPMDYGLDKIGAVIGMGSTLEEAIKMCKDVAEGVKGYYLDVLTGALDEAEKELEKSAEMGMSIL
jgi:hypothetical protein